MEPVLDKSIGIEIQNQVCEGNTIDEQKIQGYRIWQKSGQIIAGIVLGVSFGAWYLFYFWKKDTSWFNQSKEGHGFSWNRMVSNFLYSHF